MVYVDQLFDTTYANDQPGSTWPFAEGCHMFSDSIVELHLMARAIGLRFEWFQDHAELPHYDLTPGKRKSAVLAGAKSVDMRFLARFMEVRRKYHGAVTVHIGEEVYWDVGRASGLVVCKACGKQYYDHPMFQGIRSHADQPFLTLVCENLLFKL